MGDSIYFHDNDNETLYVQLYTASTVKWGNIMVEQISKFPLEDVTRFNITMSESTRFGLHVHLGNWVGMRL